jgi:hypothetical protein
VIKDAVVRIPLFPLHLRFRGACNGGRDWCKVSVLREQEGEEADERLRAPLGREVRFQQGRVRVLELLGRKLLYLRPLRIISRKGAKTAKEDKIIETSFAFAFFAPLREI